MTNTGMNAADFERTNPAEDPRIAKLERENQKLTQENKWLKESRPPETLEEIITDRLADEWIDYMDSKGHNRDHNNGMCPAHLENEFVDLVTTLRRFFENNRRRGDTYSNHYPDDRVLISGDLRTQQKKGHLEISPLQWELMIAITKYIEGHVIDSDDIIYVAEKR